MRNSLRWVLALLVCAGCSVNYQGERLFWKAGHAFNDVLIAPETAPAERWAAAVSAFDRITAEARGTLWAAQAHMTIARLQEARHDFTAARERYELLVREYDEFSPLCLRARIAMARSYEAEHRWEDAVRIYGELPVQHPWTVPAMEAPVYIAALYDRLGRRDESANAYQQAVDLYLQWIAQAPTLELVAAVKSYLALAYDHQGNWRLAVKTLEELAKDPAAANPPLVLMTLASLYESKAHNAGQARKTYEEVMERFPSHPLAGEARRQLARLGGAPVPVTPEHGARPDAETSP